MSNTESQKRYTYNEDVWDILHNVRQTIELIIDNRQQYGHGELVEQQYRFLLQNVVYQMTSLPVDREELGIDAVSDPEEVLEGFNEIVLSISLAFGITKQQIETDIRPFMRQYSVDDIRKVRKLQKNNLLH